MMHTPGVGQAFGFQSLSPHLDHTLEGNGHGLGETVLQLLFGHREHVDIQHRQGIKRIREIVQEDVKHLTGGDDAFVESPDVSFRTVLWGHIDL